MKYLITLLSLVAVSFNLLAQKSLESYVPVLKSTLDRSINVSYEKGYAIEQVKPNIYVLTDGIWQSAAIVTSEGVVLIDAPESFGMHIKTMVESVTSKPITTLIYSHGHKDHTAGSHYLSDIKNLEIIALASTSEFLRERNDSKRLVPTTTFEGAYVLKKGGISIHLNNHMNYHSPEGDLFIYVPSQKFLMVIDALAPGYVPFKNLDITMNVHDYMRVFDQILAYDFDVFVGGHLTAIGNKDDVNETKDYVYDLYETVKRVHDNTDLMAVMGGAAEKVGWDNKFLLFDVFLDKIIDESAKEIEGRWINKLAGVDVFAKSHAATMLLYVRWDD